MRSSPLRFFLTIPLVAATASAQVAFDTNIGTGLGLTDNSLSANNALGFSFTMPDGTVITAIDIDSNGRILPPGGDTNDQSETRSEFLNESTSICPYWDNIRPTGSGNDDVFFNAYNNGVQNVAVVTWQNVTEVNGSQTPFTIQCTLRADGSFGMYWDSNTPTSDCIVGVSAGGGVQDPDQWDLNCGPGFNTMSTATAYQRFPAASFDMAGGWLDWYPNGLGGWAVVTPNLVGICTPPIPNAFARSSGQGCGGIPAPPKEIDYIPDGVGGYIIVPSANTYDPNLGASVGITADDGVGTVNLGFNFALPGGTVVTQLDVDSNGRLGNAFGLSDYSPTIAEWLVDGEQIAPFWGDFNVNDTDTLGDIMFQTNNVDYATITWDRVAQFAGDAPLTWQIQLFGESHPVFPNGWTVIYHDIDAFDLSVGTTGADWLIGANDGLGIDPGEADLTALPVVTVGVGIVYELFEDGVDTWDLVQAGPNGLTLSNNTDPVIGANFDLTLENVSANSTAAWMLIGFQNLNLSLAPLGMPACTLYSSISLPAQPMAFTAGNSTATYSLPISGAPGIPLVMQAAVVNIGANPLGIEFSNAVVGATGD